MDVALPRSVTTRRRVGRWLRAGVVVGLAAALVAIVGGAMRASVRRSDVRTGVVTRGPIAASIAATGVVVPRRESVLTSSSETHVVEILRRVGDAVDPGDPILVLDAGQDVLEVERLDRQVALKANEREQARLDLERALADLVAEGKVAELSLESHEHHASRDRQLRDLGIVVDDVVRESEALVARDRIELERLGTRREQAREALAVRLQALDLERAILEKERARAQGLLDQQTVRADAAGVLTWLVATPGLAVHRGDEVARIADLNAFRVEATLSDIHAAEIRTGQEATIEANGTTLAGVVEQVRPTVDQGTLRLGVSLAESSSPALRHNLRVEVRLITARHSDAVIVKAAPYTLTDGSTAAWVVRGDRAVKTAVRLGIRGANDVEVLEGLAVGDVVLLRDMSDFGNLREVRIR